VFTIVCIGHEISVPWYAGEALIATHTFTVQCDYYGLLQLHVQKDSVQLRRRRSKITKWAVIFENVKNRIFFSHNVNFSDMMISHACWSFYFVFSFFLSQLAKDTADYPAAKSPL
jgi:hypothetical protein